MTFNPMYLMALTFFIASFIVTSPVVTIYAVTLGLVAFMVAEVISELRDIKAEIRRTSNE